MLPLIFTGSKVDDHEWFNNTDVGPRPVLDDIRPRRSIRICPNAVAAHVDVLGGRGNVISHAQTGGNASPPPHHTGLALIRLIDNLSALRVDNVEHICIVRAQGRHVGSATLMRPYETAEKALFAAKRRVV